MAIGSTVRQFRIEISDVDRGVYGEGKVKLPQHPSETSAYLATRAIAYGLEYCEDLVVGQGVCLGSEPVLSTDAGGGRFGIWVGVGPIDGERIIKAFRLSEQTAVYCHKATGPWLASLAKLKAPPAERLQLWSLPPKLITAVGETIERRNHWNLTRNDGTVYLDIGGEVFEWEMASLSWPE